MNELDKDDKKELELLIKEAQDHTNNAQFNWTELEGDYIAWRTRANALLCKALPGNSPDRAIISVKKTNRHYPLPDEYFGMLMGVKKYFDAHQDL